MQATLRAIRAHKNMSIDDAAKKIGIPTSRLRAIEQHKTMPRIPLVKKMMQVYDVDIENILFSNKEDIIKWHQSRARRKFRCSSKEVNEVCSK